jgi:DNA repair exonuclease SbcCD ATPase subunit
MNLLRLRVQNVMKLEALEVKFRKDGASTIFEGRNDVGKTTALNALAMALGGKRLCPEEPLRYGQESGFVEVDLGEFHADGPLAQLKVKRVFGKGEKLVVTDADGFRSPSPQAILDKLCAGISFDPRSFALMKPADQSRTLRELANIDFTALDQERAKLYEERTIVGRDKARFEGFLAKLEWDQDAPDEEVSVEQLIARRDEIRQHNQTIKDQEREYAEAKASLATTERNIQAQDAKVEQIKAQLDQEIEHLGQLSAEKEVLLTELSAMAAALDQLQPIGEDEIASQLADVSATNAAVRQRQKALEVKGQLDLATKDYTALSLKIEEIDRTKRQMVASAELPVAGLTFDENGVRFNGTLMSQLAFSESLRISTAIGLAMKPELPIVLIDQGSELDDEHLQMIANMAAKAGAQVIATRVGPSEKVEVHFVSGEV